MSTTLARSAGRGPTQRGSVPRKRGRLLHVTVKIDYSRFLHGEELSGGVASSQRGAMLRPRTHPKTRKGIVIPMLIRPETLEPD